jgi:hypothetical protein
MKHEANLSDVLRAGFDAEREQSDTQAVQQSLPHVTPRLPDLPVSGTAISRPMLHNDNGIVSEIPG